MFDTILFDLDGTLTDPAKGITNSFKNALKFFNEKIPSYKELCTFIGPPLVDTFKIKFNYDDEKSVEAVKKYREYFSKKGLFENKVYKEIPELLEVLNMLGKRCFVATSKPEAYSVRILEHFDLSKYFVRICGCNLDESRSNKDEVIAYALDAAKISDEDKASVLMIGDRKHDIIGARKNGIKSCGVLYGYGSQSELEQAGADFIAKDVREVLKIAITTF